jgi:hypothetical protein
VVAPSAGRVIRRIAGSRPFKADNSDAHLEKRAELAASSGNSARFFYAQSPFRFHSLR